MTRRRLLRGALAGALAGTVFAGFRRRPAEVHVASHSDLLFEGVHLFDGERFADGLRSVLVRDDSVAAIEPRIAVEAGTPRRSGGVLFPGFVDAHVHLSFSTAAAVVGGGVTGVLDLGEPAGFAFSAHPPLRYAASGPIITAAGGYPTRSWGAGGYGLEVTTTTEARDAVAMLAGRGARLIKVAIEPAGGPLLDDEALRAIVVAARSRSLDVAAHALGVEQVRTALAAGVRVLAHTPVELLPEPLVEELGAARTTVVSTIRAFGGRSSTRANLAALATAGCRIVYGTDLGNEGIAPGIDAAELEILEDALGDRDTALVAATSAAGALAGAGGRIAAGQPADLVWAPAFSSFDDLRNGVEVWVNGV